MTLRDWGLKRCTACGIGSLRGSIASLAAIGAAIRLASAPIIRCRSADLVLVQPNHRLPIVRILRRAPAMPPWQAMASLYKSEVVGNCVRVTNRRQSDSENRSRPNRIEELNAATPRAGISIPEASRSFEPETANLSLSLGVPKGIFSFAKENIPFDSAARTPHFPSALCAESNRSPEGAQKRSSPFGLPLFYFSQMTGFWRSDSTKALAFSTASARGSLTCSPVRMSLQDTTPALISSSPRK